MKTKIITIINQKGGVGKTTTAINFAAGLARQMQDVLLIDLDGQANATQGLGITAQKIENTVYDVLMNDVDPADSIIPTESELLHIMPSDMHLNGAKVELVGVKERETVLKKITEKLCGSYRYIVIDSPPSLDLLTVNALTASNSALIPIQCEYYALEGLGQLMNTLRKVKKGLNPNLMIEGVVLTMHDRRTNLSYQVVDNIKKHFKGHVYSTIIPRNVRLAEAPSFGKTIYDYAPNSTGGKEYLKLTKEFLAKQ
ncbi:MAG: AAA family ATPase [Elusimicrobia bacterium]|jgi:chromosome partitioning protein|nr:AAA family ATPase [Elusimicrobiota bacterium]